MKDNLIRKWVYIVYLFFRFTEQMIENNLVSEPILTFSFPIFKGPGKGYFRRYRQDNLGLYAAQISTNK